MNKLKALRPAVATLLSLTVFCALAQATNHVKIRATLPAFEVLGQVNNFAGAPPTSQQFGYLSSVTGIDNVYSAASPQNESTAQLTFFTQATTLSTKIDGPLKIVNRTATTTIYLNSAPASFANPDSFRSGQPVQVSSMTQQVVIDTVSGVFTVVNVNTVTESSVFELNGGDVRLGREGDQFRTILTGHLNTGLVVGGPAGWFGGYAVGMSREEREDRD